MSRRLRIPCGEGGQALVLVLGLAAALMLGTLALAGFGQALGGKARHQRGADQPRLFEAAVLENGVPNPRHLSRAHYVARARAAVVRVRARDVSFPQGFTPTRMSVRVRGDVHVRVAGSRRGEALRRVVVRARASRATSLPLLTGKRGRAVGPRLAPTSLLDSSEAEAAGSGPPAQPQQS